MNRLHVFFLMDRKKAELTARRLDPANPNDNKELFEYYNEFYKRGEELESGELLKIWFDGKYLKEQKGEGLVLTMVCILNHQFWKFQTDSFPYFEYITKSYDIPGTD